MKGISKLIKLSTQKSKARSEWELQVEEVMNITGYGRGRVLTLLKGIGVTEIRRLIHESGKPEIKNRAAWLQWKINDRKGGERD